MKACWTHNNLGNSHLGRMFEDTGLDNEEVLLMMVIQLVPQTLVLFLVPPTLKVTRYTKKACKLLIFKGRRDDEVFC